MAHDATGIPEALRLSFDAAPSVETRRALGHEIDAFNARTVPQDARRFALLLRDEGDRLAAGLSGVLSWQWLFVEALWVGDAWRGRGIGRALLARAEAHAVAAGCHSAWLDTFQARGFYLALGYREFGALPDYPAGQTRYFLCKRLVGVVEAPAAGVCDEATPARLAPG
ncbi:MAG TPA: GNAT family N-acetyltransferase [Acetobacteraceae bacterium]|nr:GNAT family N-acetyltransferase [Acetobacteraceae bacterium]